jgi:hypothetical protein
VRREREQGCGEVTVARERCATEEESPRIAVGRGGIFILQIVLRRLLEGKIVPLVAHFEDADASEAPAGVSLMNTTASLNATHA